MDPSDLGYSKNMILETQRLMSDSDFMALYNDSVKIQKALGTQNVELLPEALVSASIDISSALKEINISHINSFLGHLDQIPNEDFKVIKQTITQNRSKIRDAAKANYETASDIVRQSSENEDDKTLVLPISVAELVADLDDSIELPDPDADKKVRIPLSWRGVAKIIAAVSGFASSVVTLYDYLSKIILK